MAPRRALPAAAALVTTLFAALTLPMAGPATAAASPGSAGGSRAPRPVASGARMPVTDRIVVGYKRGTAQSTRDQLLAKVGAARQRLVPGLDATVATARDPQAALVALRRDPRVAYAQREVRFHAFAEASQPERAELGLTAPEVANDQKLTGAGQTVAVLDSGVDPSNPDLSSTRIVDGGDYTPLLGDSTTPSPTGGTVPTQAHGTAVATLIAGAANGSGITGAAPATSILAVKVIDSDGGTADDVVAQAIVATARRAQSDSSLVALNLSLGGVFDSQVLRDAITTAHALAPRLVIVAAAGNDGMERAAYPAGDPYVLSVGATERGTDGVWRLAPFSNRGDVDVVAPGARITTWWSPPGESSACLTSERHTDAAGGVWCLQYLDGTSFAAPEVAGLVAGVAGYGVVGDAARALLQASAAPPASTPPSYGEGVGRARLDTARGYAQGTPGEWVTTSVVRGGGVAVSVGRRTVETFHLQPSGSPVPASLTATAGSVTAPGNVTSTTTPIGTLVRATATYTAPASGAGTDQVLTAAAGTVSQPRGLRLLPATDGPEGVPTSFGRTDSVDIAFGSQSAYVRTIGVASGRMVGLDFSIPSKAWTQGMPVLAVWGPPVNGGTADAADSPDLTYGDGGTTSPPSGLTGFSVGGSSEDDFNRAGTFSVGFVVIGSDGLVDDTVNNGRYSLGAHTAADVTAIAGTSSVPYSYRPGTGWRNLGGRVSSTPVVVSVPHDTFYLATGSDRSLYVRSDSRGWTRLAPSSYRCYELGATVADNLLYVGCRGTNQVLYVTRTTIRAGTLPYLSSLSRRGGLFSAGPSVAVIDGAVTFFGTGTNTTGANVFQHKWTDAAGRFWRLPPAYRCTDAPSVVGGLTDAVLACNRGGRLAVGQYLDSWGSLQDLGGGIVHGPGVSRAPNGTYTFWAQGTDGALWSRVVGVGVHPWRRVGGGLRYGARGGEQLD